MIYIHNINPVMFSFGVIKIYYYSLAYLFGAIFIPYYIKKNYLHDKKLSDNFSIYIIFGVVFGGRLGYVLFYDLKYFFLHPLEIIRIWEGGMSFHGGLIGYTLGTWLFSKKYKRSFLKMMELSSFVVPIGLFIGRMMNFVNGELYGRATNQSWGILFPIDERQVLRHPSQIYEAIGEGVLLFLIMFFIRKIKFKNNGCISVLFLLFYGIIRFFLEFFREPDVQIGYISNYFTLGQILCVAMIFCGFLGFYWINRKKYDT